MPTGQKGGEMAKTDWKAEAKALKKQIKLLRDAMGKAGAKAGRPPAKKAPSRSRRWPRPASPPCR